MRVFFYAMLSVGDRFPVGAGASRSMGSVLCRGGPDPKRGSGRGSKTVVSGCTAHRRTGWLFDGFTTRGGGWRLRSDNRFK